MTIADLAFPIGGKGQPIRLSASVLQGVAVPGRIANSPCNFTESRITTHLSKRRVNRWARYLQGSVFADPFLYFPMPTVRPMKPQRPAETTARPESNM